MLLFKAAKTRGVHVQNQFRTKAYQVFMSVYHLWVDSI